jgi:hypothetical protein
MSTRFATLAVLALFACSADAMMTRSQAAAQAIPLVQLGMNNAAFAQAANMFEPMAPQFVQTQPQHNIPPPSLLSQESFDNAFGLNPQFPPPAQTPTVSLDANTGTGVIPPAPLLSLQRSSSSSMFNTRFQAPQTPQTPQTPFASSPFASNPFAIPQAPSSLPRMNSLFGQNPFPQPPPFQRMNSLFGQNPFPQAASPFAASPFAASPFAAPQFAGSPFAPPPVAASPNFQFM